MATDNSTPLDVNKVAKDGASVKVKTLSHKSFKFSFDKYNLILLAAILFFIISISFWSYVNFFLATP